MNAIDTTRQEQAKALSNGARLQILTWLKQPRRYFAHQLSGDPAQFGVCVSLIAEKLAVSQPAASRHLEVLRRAGLVTVTRRDNWAFYARREEEIDAYREWLHDTI